MDTTYCSCLKKQEEVKALFQNQLSAEAKYEYLIDLGRKLPPLPPECKNRENLVIGCQSAIYLRARMENGAVFFDAESDALVTSGLVALLVSVYNGETPQTILKCPPTFLEDLGIQASLTPSRVNGLHRIHLKMRQEAVKLLVLSMKGPPTITASSYHE